MKRVKVFSEKLGTDVSVELEGNGTSITAMYDTNSVSNVCALSSKFENRAWESWMNNGWNNWGAICN
jgi:hypothetical protein